MTEIYCKICEKKITFNLNNPETYLHKSESGNVLIGKLYTIRVSHLTDSGSIHINVIVIDEKGDYRAHKDCYEEKQSVEGAPDLWNELQRFIPLEIRPYLSLANMDDKRNLSSTSESLDKTAKEWYEYLIEIKNENPKSQLLTFLAVKWGFIIGKGKDLVKDEYEPNSWSYPLYLRLQARFAPSAELMEKAKNLEFKLTPLLIQLEAALAKAEVYLRLSAYDLLESLYDECQEKWSDQTSIEVKSGLMLLQGYYGFRLYFLGRINEAMSFIEPVFNFGQLLGNREIISVTGNFYGAVNQSSGDLEKALSIFEIVLKVSEELGDERTNAVISSNMSVIESKQGLYDQALKRQRSILELPIVQEEFFIKSSLMSIIAETLFISERYEESKELCQQVLSEENLPTYYKIDLLATLKRIAGKTDSLELLDFVKNNLPKDSDFLDSPVGHIFMHDLEALDGELHNDWQRLIDNLKEEREIMFENLAVEDASDIEIRLAEGYFSFFQENGELEYLNNSYNHLDLAKTIAIENQRFLEICRLEMLKGLLAAESNIQEQARIHFEEALKTAQEYNLTNIEKELTEQLEQLSKGTIGKSAGSILRRMFNRLTFRKTDEVKSKQETIIYTIWIETHDSSWRVVLENAEKGSSENTNYLIGFHDLWDNVRNNLLQQQVKYFSVSRGAVIIEDSENFQLIALGDQPDYFTRLKIQNLLPGLEDTSLKDLPEELTETVMKLINKSLGNFTEVDLN